MGRKGRPRSAHRRWLRGDRTRHRLLRHVRVVRLQARACRDLAPHRRPRAAAGARGCEGRRGGGERLFLPRADRSACRPADAASRRNPGAAVSFEVLVYVALVCLISGFAHGALGFGFPLVATPLVALVIDIKSAIAILAPLTLVLTVISSFRGGPLMDVVRRFWFVPLATAAGAWLGTRVLIATPPEPF